MSENLDYMSIKDGDKVICIEKGGNNSIEKGKIYEVEKVYDHMLKLKWPNTHLYYANRFKKLEKEEGENKMEYFKGMKIVCIDDENILNRSKGKLEKGKEYIVEDWTSSAVKVKGLNNFWRNERFLLSNNNSEEKLLEKMQKLTERKIKLEVMEKITERKMIEIGDEKRSVRDELKRVTGEYSALIKKKLEEMK